MAENGKQHNDGTARGTPKSLADAEMGTEKAGVSLDRSSSTPKAEASTEDLTTAWDADGNNPYNWPARRKHIQLAMVSMSALTASIATSITSPAVFQLQEEFGINMTLAILPLSLYVFALALGPAISGPISETIGRYPVYLFSMPLAALFTIGAALTHSFAALCILRFLAGICFSPSLSISAGTINEIYRPIDRAIPSALLILMPFLGPGLGPVIGAFTVSRKGWRWTQWTLVFFSVATILLCLFGEETYHSAIQRRLMKKRGIPVPAQPPLKDRMQSFLKVALLRPIRMLFLEPIVALICLYVAFEFATLFSFFAAVPYVFGTVYGFPLEHVGLVFLANVIGCLLGTVTVILCNAFIYLPRARKHEAAAAGTQSKESATDINSAIPPEYRLFPAMIGSVGIPIGLFLFGWTARTDISWASPAAGLIIFAWGNLCVFVSTMQYIVDSYSGSVVASAAGANSLARYGLAGAFPLFAVHMYKTLGIDWATSLLGFVAVALLPVPWAFFKWGKGLRARSVYETSDS